MLNGMDDLKRKLAKLDGNLSAALESAVTSGAILVQNDAKILAPYLTGNLRRSIHTATIEKSDVRVVVAVGTDVEYAKTIEFGGSRKAPQGYLRPAADKNRDKIVKEIKDALGDIVRKVAT